jgi:glycosyltransferase involved in cell wall biosynthesis
VRRLLVDTYGIRAEIRRLPYASPAAFGAAPDEPDLPDATAIPAKPAVPAHLAELQPATAPLIVVVARHDPRKGLDVLLRCLADLRRAGIPFRACLVGPGTLLASHRELAARLGLGATTALPGYVDDPFPYLLHADLFVLPTLEEGSGSVALLEALQAGCAVVATACDGIPEDLVHGESALLVPPGEAGALRGALHLGLVDGALRRRLAAGARAVYETRFSRHAFVAALAGVYGELGLTPG